MNLSDENAHGLCDGELDDATRQQIREAITGPEIARRVASHQALRDSLRSSFEPVLAEAVPDRLLAAARSRRFGRFSAAPHLSPRISQPPGACGGEQPVGYRFREHGFEARAQ